MRPVNLRLAPLDPDTPGYPWIDPCTNPINFPTPSQFWDWNGPFWGEDAPHIDEVVRAYLASGLLLAGCDPELAESSQSQFRRLRQAARRALLSCEWNIELYGTINANYCGGIDPQMPGCRLTRPDKHVLVDGVGLHCLSFHDDVRAALELGEPPVRTIELEGEIMDDVEADSMPFLWMPAIDLEALARLEVRLLEWPDGVSTAEPPPLVRNIGIRRAVEDVLSAC